MSQALILIYWHADIFFHLSSISAPRSVFQNFPRLLFSLAKHTLQGILLLYQHLSKNIAANADVAPLRLTAGHLLNPRETTCSIAHVYPWIKEYTVTFRRAAIVTSTYRTWCDSCHLFFFLLTKLHSYEWMWYRACDYKTMPCLHYVTL